MKYHERKPDLETESMRVWIPNKEEAEELKKTDEGDIKIDYKGNEIIVGGFNKAMKKDGNLLFIWKFKHQEHLILYYIFEENCEEEDLKKAKEAIEMLRLVNSKMGMNYQIQDMKETFDNTLNEMPSLENLTKLKEKRSK